MSPEQEITDKTKRISRDDQLAVKNRKSGKKDAALLLASGTYRIRATNDEGEEATIVTAPVFVIWGKDDVPQALSVTDFAQTYDIAGPLTDK